MSKCPRRYLRASMAPVDWRHEKTRKKSCVDVMGFLYLVIAVHESVFYQKLTDKFIVCAHLRLHGSTYCFFYGIKLLKAFRDWTEWGKWSLEFFSGSLRYKLIYLVFIGFVTYCYFTAEILSEWLLTFFPFSHKVFYWINFTFHLCISGSRWWGI